MPVRYCSELFPTYTGKERSDVHCEGISNTKHFWNNTCLVRKGSTFYHSSLPGARDTEINKEAYIEERGKDAVEEEIKDLKHTVADLDEQIKKAAKDL